MALPRILAVVNGLKAMLVPVSASTGAAQANSVVATNDSGYVDPSLVPAVAVTGGTVDNTTIGGTTPAAGKFTALTASGLPFLIDNSTFSGGSTYAGLGTATPWQWNGVSLGSGQGSNFQVYGPIGSARFILVCNGSGANAEFHFVNMNAPSNSRNWRLFGDSTGTFTMAMNTDNYSSATTAWTAAASGAMNFAQTVAVTGLLTASGGVSTPTLTLNGTSVVIGTSGAKLGLLNTANTWSATQTFGQISPTSVVSSGAISGTTLTGTGVVKSTSQVATGISAKSAAYTCTTNDFTVLGNATSAAFTITLEASPVTGQVRNIKKIDASANVLTISGNGKNIDGGTTYSLSTQYQNATLQYDGTQWWII